MYPFNNAVNDPKDNAEYLSVPGKATFKALSIISFPFFQHAERPEKFSKIRDLVKELAFDVEILKQHNSHMEPALKETPELNATAEVHEDISLPSKAQGMVQHLKHTKSSAASLN